MMNYIAVAWNNFFIFAVWTEGGFQMSKVFPKTAWLPRLTDFAAQVPIFRGLTTHLGLIFGLIAAVDRLVDPVPQPAGDMKSA